VRRYLLGLIEFVDHIPGQELFDAMNATLGSFSIFCSPALSENLSAHGGRAGSRQLLWHRHKPVRMRTMLDNQLHFLAMNQGLCLKQKLFSKKGRTELQGLALARSGS
jgi:hypothetical protein